MSKPVEVTNEVAEILQRNLVEEHSHGLNLYNVLNYIALNYDLEEFLEDDLAAQELLDAITNGYVVPYEFKERDVVATRNGALFTLVSDAHKPYCTLNNMTLSEANKMDIKLVCKAENREDKAVL